MSRESILQEIAVERIRQFAKFGEQQLPSVDAVLMERPGGCTPERMAEDYEIPTARRAKYMTDNGHELGHLTFTHILVEEVAEGVEAAVQHYPDERPLRAELVQAAAVIVQWVEELDRRECKALTKAESSAYQNKAPHVVDWPGTIKSWQNGGGETT